MIDLTQHNPLDRFSGLASVYAQHRPSYPEQALDHLLNRAQLSDDALIVDLGSGTGISTRWLAERGYHVIGIEPNADMRAEADRCSKDDPHIEYREGSGEATGLESKTVDVVMAAQAFHWFNQQAALDEMARILKPGGHVALIWNIRDDSDPLTAAYGDVILSFPDAKIVEQPEDQYVDLLWQHPRFEDAEKVVFANGQDLTEEGLIGRARSVSYAPRDPELIDKITAQLKAIHAEHQQNGLVQVRYKTILSVAKKSS